MKTRYGLEIRSATSADAAGLSCTFLARRDHAVSARVLAERLDAIRRHSGVVLIAAEWGPPSGMIMAHWDHTLDAEQPTAQITGLLVGADERRRGIGRLLVKAAAQAAKALLG